MDNKRVKVCEEMLKLEALLRIAGIPHETYFFPSELFESIQICAPSLEDCKIDAVSHQFCYGGDAGLIEIMAESEEDVVGWLKAEDAFEYFRKEIRNEEA